MNAPFLNQTDLEVEETQRRLIRAIKSRLSLPDDSLASIVLTEDELAVFQDEISGMTVDQISAEFSEQMAKFASLANPEEVGFFLHAFSAWITQKRAEHKSAAPLKPGENPTTS